MDVGAAGIKSEQEIRSGQDLEQFLATLDETSRTILMHLWWNRHASIADLRNILDGASDFDILSRLRDVINNKAVAFQGKPIVGFEQSKIDSVTGEKVMFEWWFLEQDIEGQNFQTSDKPLVDVFNEKDALAIVVSLPSSVDTSHPTIEVKNGVLKLTLKKNLAQNVSQKKRRRAV